MIHRPGKVIVTGAAIKIMTSKARALRLSSKERWILYFVFCGLPGLNVALWFGFQASLLFELFVWIPQQRIFDHFELEKSFSRFQG